MTLSLRLRTLELPLRDPFVIARAEHGRGPAGSRRSSRSCATRRTAPTGPSGWARATRTRTTATRPRRWPRSPRCCSRRSSVIEPDLRGGRRRRPRGARGRRGADDRGHRPPRRDQVRHRHRAPRPRRQAAGPAGPRADRPAGRDPADRLHAGHRRPGRRRRAGPPRRRLPGAQDQGGRPGRPRDARGGPGRLRGPDPGRRQHRLDARGRAGAAARTSSAWAWSSSSSRSRPAGWTSCAGSRSAPPLPIVADESAVTIEDLDALVGVVAGRQRQARQVRRPRARRGGCWSAPGSSASGRSSAAWRRRRSGSRPRPRSRRSPSGWTSTAACCSPTTRSTGLELGPDKRWRLADRPGLGLELRADARP